MRPTVQDLAILQVFILVLGHFIYSITPKQYLLPNFDFVNIGYKYWIGGVKRKTDADTSVTNPNVDDDVDLAECEKLMKDVNSFDNNKAAVTIPDEGNVL
jgi:hypothetical protein